MGKDKMEPLKAGIDSSRSQQLQSWVNEQHKTGNIGWGSVFLSANVARAFVKQFEFPVQEMTLLGIGLPMKYITMFIEESRSPEGIIPSGVHMMVQKKVPLEPEGEVLGYEVLGWELPHFHSWICYHFEKEAYEKLGVYPNGHGFFARFEDAERLADFANNSDVQEETKPWLPWLIAVYSLENTAQ